MSTESSISSWLETLAPQDTSISEPGTIPISPPCASASASPRPLSLSRKRKSRDSDDSDTSSESRRRRKLTAGALDELEAIMSPSNNVPGHGGARTPTSSTKSLRKDRENLGEITKSLQAHGMHYADDNAWDIRCKSFRDKVLEPFSSDRNSEMRPNSHKNAKLKLKETRDGNEATFHKEMAPLILKDSYTLKTKKRDAKGELILVVQSYSDDECLRSQEKPVLANGFVPGKDYTKKEMGMTEPRPDTVYGKLCEPFPDQEDLGPEAIRAIKSVGCTVDWPFFVFEAKPAKDGVPPARNQAQRDCGAILKSLLKLKEYVEGKGYRDKPGAVEDFWVFSMCWTPDYANIFVHWVEIKKSGVEIFHTTKLSQQFMDDEDGQAALRAAGHNIFDHGLFTHIPAIEGLWKKAIKAGKPFEESFQLYD